MLFRVNGMTFCVWANLGGWFVAGVEWKNLGTFSPILVIESNQHSILQSFPSMTSLIVLYILDTIFVLLARGNLLPSFSLFWVLQLPPRI